MSGEGGPLATARSARIGDERDGFGALLGAFGRQVERAERAGTLDAAAGAVLRRRIDTMIEQVALGLHLTGGAA